MKILIMMLVVLFMGDSHAIDKNIVYANELEKIEFAATCTVKIRNDKKTKTYTLSTKRTSLKYIGEQCWQAADRLKGEGKISLVKWERI